MVGVVVLGCLGTAKHHSRHVYDEFLTLLLPLLVLVVFSGFLS